MLRVAVIWLLFFMAFGHICAQKQAFNTIDSLEKQLKSSEADTHKVFLLNRLATVLRQKDNRKAFTYAEQARLLAERVRFKEGIGLALENLGWIYYQKGALEQAFQTSMEALKINDSLQNKALVAKILNTIASVNIEQKQYALATVNLKRAYGIGKSMMDYNVMSTSLNNLAYACLSKDELDSALFYANEEMKVSERSGEQSSLARALRTTGDIFLRMGKVERAEENYHQCLQIAHDTNNNYLKASAHFRLGKLYNKRRHPDQGIMHLKESIKLARRYEYNEELEGALREMATSYELMGDRTKAYKYQEKFIEFHDSLYAKRNTEQLALMQAKFESDLKQAQIGLLVKDTQIKQHEIESQKVWLYFSIGCLSLLMILAFVLFDSYRRIKVINLELKRKNTEIQDQARQLNNVNVTKDKLFSIISHDMRSPVASLKALMSIIGNSNLTQEEFISITATLKRRLDSLYDDLDNLLQWAQSQLKGLKVKPETFDLKKLVDEKVELFREAARFKKVKLMNEISEGSYVLADKNHISLVLRNLLTNAIKFTPDEGSVKINCGESEEQFEISVSDSGIGIGTDDLNKLFNAQTHFTKRGTHEEKGIGIGLLLTKEFVESNGGSIWVNSELGKGSTFTFTVKRQPAEIMVS